MIDKIKEENGSMKTCDDSEETVLVSVVMSSFNTSREYLLAAVKSILRQTYNNIELIVIIDGGEYDNCLSCFADDRLKVIVCKDTCGLAVRLNEAFSIARGKYIARMDCDDFSLPDRLYIQKTFMDQNPEVEMCGMFAKRFGKSSKYIINPCIDNKSIKAELFFNNILIHPTIMFRADCIHKKEIIYNEEYLYSQDYELWTRILRFSTFAVIPKVGLFYRSHCNQVSDRKRDTQRNLSRMISTLNLTRLGMSDKYLPYIDFLNYSKPYKEGCNFAWFISACLNKLNTDIYDKSIFKDVIYRHAFTAFFRNHRYIEAFKYLKLGFFAFAFKKFFYILTNCVRLIKYHKLYKLLKNGKD